VDVRAPIPVSSSLVGLGGHWRHNGEQSLGYGQWNQGFLLAVDDRTSLHLRAAEHHFVYHRPAAATSSAAPSPAGPEDPSVFVTSGAAGSERPQPRVVSHAGHSRLQRTQEIEQILLLWNVQLIEIRDRRVGLRSLALMRLDGLHQIRSAAVVQEKNSLPQAP
jgi:hypothetical protein